MPERWDEQGNPIRERWDAQGNPIREAAPAGNLARIPEEKPPGYFQKAYDYSPLPLIPEIGKALVESPMTLGGGPLRRRLVDEPQVEAGKKAIEAYREGRPMEAAARGVLAPIPFFGPMATSAIEDISGMIGRREYKGVAGALTELAASAAMPKVAGKTLEVGGKVASRPFIQRRLPVSLKTPEARTAFGKENLAVSTRIMDSYGKPPRRSYDFDINPGEEAARAVVEGKVAAKTTPEAIQAFGKYKDTVGAEIEGVVRRADQTPDIPIADAIQGPVSKALAETRNKGPIESVSAWLQEHFPAAKMSPAELWEGIQKIDRQTKFKEGTMEEMNANAVLQEVRAGLRRKLEARVPEIVIPSRTYASIIRFNEGLENAWRSQQSSPLPAGPQLPTGFSQPQSKVGYAAAAYRYLRPLRGAILKEDLTATIFSKVKKFGREVPSRPQPDIQPWQRSMGMGGNTAPPELGPLFSGELEPMPGATGQALAIRPKIPLGPGTPTETPRTPTIRLAPNPAAMSEWEAPGWRQRIARDISGEVSAARESRLADISRELNRKKSNAAQHAKRQAEAQEAARKRRAERFSKGEP